MKCKHWEPGEWKNEEQPKCAFDRSGHFMSTNWNCRPMNELREIAKKSAVYNGDHYCSIIPFNGYEFAVICWYKSRGKTEGFWIMNGIEVRRGSEKDARKIVEEMNHDK